MKYSIIVPVYNVVEYLHICLDSIIHQSYRDFEIILVDDGSTDGSSEICDYYVERFENCKCIHQKNQGVSSARNTGLKVAHGEWIAFVDSDDWIEADMLMCLNEYVESEAADLYCFNMKRADENLNIKRIAFSTENSCRTFMSEKDKFNYYLECFMQYKVGWEVYTRLFNKKIIDDNKIYFVDMAKVYAEDYLFTFCYMLNINRIYFLNHFFYTYRERDTSLFHSRDNIAALRGLKVWASEAYEAVCKFELQYFKKHFAQLFFTLIQQQTQSALSGLSKAEIHNIIFNENLGDTQREWIQKLKRHKLLYLLEMRTGIWL